MGVVDAGHQLGRGGRADHVKMVWSHQGSFCHGWYVYLYILTRSFVVDLQAPPHDHAFKPHIPGSHSSQARAKQALAKNSSIHSKRTLARSLRLQHPMPLARSHSFGLPHANPQLQKTAASQGNSHADTPSAVPMNARQSVSPPQNASQPPFLPGDDAISRCPDNSQCQNPNAVLRTCREGEKSSCYKGRWHKAREPRGSSILTLVWDSASQGLWLIRRLWLVQVQGLSLVRSRRNQAMLVATTVGKFGNNSRPILGPFSERPVVHLVWQNRVREMVLLKKRGWRRVEECVDVANGLVRAVALL